MDKDSFRPNPVFAAALAWIVPGAGHLHLRKRTRGIVLMVTIGLLFWGGVAMGGAMTVSNQSEPWWFASDMLTGAHGLIGWQYQKWVYDDVFHEAMRKAAAEGKTPDSASIQAELVDKELSARKLALVPPVDTAARAFSGVAGLLNLLCIFDAMMLALMNRVGEPPRSAFSRKPKASAGQEDASSRRGEKGEGRGERGEVQRSGAVAAASDRDTPLDNPGDAYRGGEEKG